MITCLFSFLLFIHGCIHLAGFAKGTGIAKVAAIQSGISKGAGLLWLLTALLMIISSISVLAGMQHWWITAVPAALLSQLLIFNAWKDAKFGTAANVIILLAALLAGTDF
ncbi:MAG: hypothetical protein K1X61_02935 [Chitinophagales bacterium]|nr:hypothetical protein [Chitinophagales bacterium]